MNRQLNLSQEVREGIVHLLAENVHQGNHLLEFYSEVKDSVPQQGGSGKVLKVFRLDQPGQILAAKCMDLEFDENDYEDSSVSSMSRSDSSGLINFFQCCQEAVLQREQFTHANVVKCTEAWLQTEKHITGNSESIQLDISMEIIDLIRFLETGETILTPSVRTALEKVRGLQFFLVMDYYSMNLKQWLNEQTESDDDVYDEKRKLIQDMASGLSYIHKLGYIHTDIKPPNVMIEKDPTRAAITDFGLCVLENEDNSLSESLERPGTYPYNSAPDRFYTTKFDMWSLGLVIYSLVKNEEITYHEFSDIRRNGGVVAEYLKSKLTNEELERYSSMLEGCLQPGCNDRWSAEQLLEHLGVLDSEEINSSLDS